MARVRKERDRETPLWILRGFHLNTTHENLHFARPTIFILSRFMDGVSRIKNLSLKEKITCFLFEKALE